MTEVRFVLSVEIPRVHRRTLCGELYIGIHRNGRGSFLLRMLITAYITSEEID